MERVRFTEVDTPDEVCKTINRVIDNLNLVEGKLLQTISANKKLASKSWVGKLLAPKKTKEEQKGFINMKTLLMVFVMAIVMLFATNTLAYVASDINYDIASNPETLQQYLRDTMGAGTFAFTPQSAPTAGSISQGLVYFDSGVNLLKVSLDGSSFATVDTAGGVSLDGAYDFGSAGGGRTINATDGAVQVTNTDNDTASLLGLTYSGNTTGDGLTITMSVGSGDAIEIENTGTGLDIEGTGALFTASKDGAITCVGLTNTAGDVLYDDTYDLSWDTSADQLLFEDNAVLGIGGAHDAAGDVTFKWDTSNLLVESATEDTGEIQFGSTNAIDVVHYANTNTSTAKFNASTATLEFTAYDVQLLDDDVIAFGDSDEFTVYYDETTTDNLFFVATNANDAVQFGDGSTSSTDVKMMAATDGDFVHFDSSADELFFEDADLKINEGAQIEFSVGDNSVDWTIDVSTDETLLFGPSETDDTSTFNIGDATNTSDVRFFGKNASTVVFDTSADLQTNVNYDILLDDASTLIFGSGSDWSVYSDTGDTLEFDPGGAGDQFYLGTSDTDAADVTWFSDRSGAILFLDEEAASVNFGVDATGLDAVFYGDTTLLQMKWDQTNDLLSFDGGNAMLEFRGATVDVHETTLATVEPTASNVLTLADDTGALGYTPGGSTTKDASNAAVPLTHSVVIGTTGGASAWSLPDGSPGQVLSIVVGTDGGTCTLTPVSTTGDGWATMIFLNDGDGASFMFVDTTVGWLITGTFGISTNPLITGE